MARKAGSTRVTVAGILLCFACSLAAKQVGKFMYRGVPEDFTTPKFNGTVIVSDTMVAMAEKIRVINKFLTDSLPDTPSIFFIIDNSTSMSIHDPTDQMGNRFKVTSAFIDTIYKKFPSAEVGYAVFVGELLFRARDNALFKAFPTLYDKGGAYLPLRKLNQTYNGQTGLAIAKHFLETKMIKDTLGWLNEEYADLVYTPSEEIEPGTNINVGFDAAKDAFSNSLQKTKECHYAIFLSDGDANAPKTDPFDFVKGTNVPATFTVFFTPDNQIPPNISTMTANIRNNGYSRSNPMSKCWPYKNATPDQFVKFLKNNIFDSFLAYKPPPPESVTVNGQTMTSWNPAENTGGFSTLFPLSGFVTPFNCRIKYPTKRGDTTCIVDFTVKTQAGFLMPPVDFEVKLWDRDIVFRYKGAPVTVVTDAMNQIELLFPWNGGTANYNYTNVTIDLYTTAPPVDHETVALTAGVNGFTGTIKRATSAVKTPMNGTIENDPAGSDSIIAVFRNSETPKLPLDTLRVTIPVNPVAALRPAKTPDFGIHAVRNQSGLVVRYGSGKEAGGAVAIYGIDGRLLKRLPPVFPGRVVTYTWSNAPAGVYLIRFTGNKGGAVRKAGY